MSDSNFFFFNFSVSSVARSCLTLSLWPHGLQHTRPPCLSSTPRAYSNSCPWIQWCHPTISSSIIPFSSCPQSFPASVSFQMRQLFTSGGQRIGISASASVLPMNIQDWFLLGWTGWISLQFKGLSRVFSNTTAHKSCKISPGLVILGEGMYYFLLSHSHSHMGRAGGFLRHFSLTFRLRSRVPWGRPLCVLVTIDSNPLSD